MHTGAYPLAHRQSGTELQPTTPPIGEAAAAGCVPTGDRGNEAIRTTSPHLNVTRGIAEFQSIRYESGPFTIHVVGCSLSLDRWTVRAKVLPPTSASARPPGPKAGSASGLYYRWIFWVPMFCCHHRADHARGFV